MPEEFALEQGFGQRGAFHHHQRAARPGARFVDGARDQFLAGARLAHQQHGGFGGAHAADQLQHLAESGRAPDQSVLALHAFGPMQLLHPFDEKRLLAQCVHQRNELDVDVGLAMRGVVQVQHPFALPGFPGHGHGAAFARLVARALEVVRHLMAGAPDDRSARPELPPVGRIRSQDAVARVDEDMRRGHAFEIRHQLGRWGGHAALLGRDTANLAVIVCQVGAVMA